MKAQVPQNSNFGKIAYLLVAAVLCALAFFYWRLSEQWGFYILWFVVIVFVPVVYLRRKRLRGNAEKSDKGGEPGEPARGNCSLRQDKIGVRVTGQGDNQSGRGASRGDLL